MHIYRLLGLMLLVGSITGCGSSSSEETPPPAPPSLPAVEEDDLLLRLSALYDPDTTLHARDNNALLDYAISNLLDVRPTATGLYYQILKPGTGDSIRWGDHLSAHYKGVLPDGTVFADSRPRKTPLVFYVGNMIDGWNEGLQLLRIGGRIRLLVPSHLGYGAAGLVSSTGRTIVPPHQVLLFDVEVLEKVE